MKIPVVDVVLSPHDWEVFPTTSSDENSIELVFLHGSELSRWFETDSLGFETEILQKLNWDTQNTNEIKEEQEEDLKEVAGDEEMEKEEKKTLHFSWLLM